MQRLCHHRIDRHRVTLTRTTDTNSHRFRQSPSHRAILVTQIVYDRPTWSHGATGPRFVSRVCPFVTRQKAATTWCVGLPNERKAPKRLS